jgi:hypothetical protein
MQRALVADRFAVALLLETHAYGYYVLREENEERFRRSFSLWMDDMRQAGRRAAERLKPLPAPAKQDASGVAFYLQSGSILAHTRLLLDFLEAHAALQRPMIRPFVFLRGKAHPELSSRLSAIGVPCCELEAQVGDGQAAYFDCLLALRGHIAEKRIAAVVWVSVAVHMAFAFALRVAPVQIWWALKYHSLELPEADGYLTSGSAGSTKLVGGKPWRSSPLASDDWYRPQLAARAAEVRAQYAQHELLFACLGRTEKMNSESFLAAVAEILRACPRAGFLWTGRDRSPEIQRRFEQLGVAARCHFIGWVDTKLYAQVLDIFLDSFPFPCGFTLYEAMAAGKPVVAYASAEAAETGLHGLLGPLLAGETGTAAEQEAARGMFSESLYSCASDPAHYVALALRLGGNSDLRARAGDAHRKFVGAFLSDRERMARTLGTHLVEIIDQAGPR